MLLNVGPEYRAPSVRAMTLFSDRNGASPPKEPRLSPNTTSLGRCASGISRISASTASNNACPACRAFSLSTRNDSQLGRNEYCMRHDRGVAVVHVLQRRRFGLVDPAGAGRGGDGDHVAVQPAGAEQLFGGQRRGGLDSVGGMQSGVGADRLDRGLAVELRELVDRRAGRHEHPALVAERLPAGQRLRAAGPQLRRRRGEVGVRLVVDRGEGLVEVVHPDADDDAVEQRDAQRQQQDHNDNGRNPRRCNAIELPHQEAHQLADELADLDEDEQARRSRAPRSAGGPRTSAVAHR